MHLAELAQEKCEHHDAGDHCELSRLEINRPEMQPTARAVNAVGTEQQRGTAAFSVELDERPDMPLTSHRDGFRPGEGPRPG